MSTTKAEQASAQPYEQRKYFDRSPAVGAGRRAQIPQMPAMRHPAKTAARAARELQ